MPTQNHAETEYDVCRAGRGWSQPRERAQAKRANKHEREIGAHVPEVWDAEEGSAVRECVVGRILGERRQPEGRSDSPHGHRAKEPRAPVLSAHVYEDPWFEAELLSEQISYIGYPAIINAQFTPEIKGLSICSCRRYIQYPWSRIFNIPARNVPQD